MKMKVGNRIVVKTEGVVVKELAGRTGTIIREKISDSQMAMLCGTSRWDVKFDEPVTICGTRFSICGGFREEELELLPDTSIKSEMLM